MSASEHNHHFRRAGDSVATYAAVVGRAVPKPAKPEPRSSQGKNARTGHTPRPDGPSETPLGREAFGVRRIPALCETAATVLVAAAGTSVAQIPLAMDPVTCPLCESAIPGNEIHTIKACPRCGADLSHLIRRRLATQPPTTPQPSDQASWFWAQAALFSLVAPCVSIGLNLLGRGAVRESRIGMLILGIVCSSFIIGGFILGIVALLGPKEKGKGTVGKAIGGISINGLLISLAVFSIFMHQKIAARDANTPARPSKGWSYISGK